MIFTIDIGNTQIKIAQFDKEQITNTITFHHFDEAMNFINKVETSQIIWCSVKNLSDDFYSKINSKKNIHQHFLLESNTPVPIQNLYSSPKTLGLDRLAGAVGATSIFTNNPVLIIDAGTCITYDFVNHQNEYLGGSISPGFMLRYKALHQYTDKLPLLNSISAIKMIGNNTHEAIQSGVVNGVIAEMKGIIDHYNNQFEKLRTVICGGDAEFIYQEISEKNQLKNISIEKNLIHIGLKKILEHLHSINYQRK